MSQDFFTFSGELIAAIAETGSIPCLNRAAFRLTVEELQALGKPVEELTFADIKRAKEAASKRFNNAHAKAVQNAIAS